jgi:hypothetical protein
MMPWPSHNCTSYSVLVRSDDVVSTTAILDFAHCASVRVTLTNNDTSMERPMRTRASTWIFGPILGAVIAVATSQVAVWLVWWVHLGAR